MSLSKFVILFSIGTGWKRVDGLLSGISSSKEVWGVYKNVVFKREGATAVNPLGTNWIKIEGEMKQVDSFDDEVWAVNNKNNIYKRNCRKNTIYKEKPEQLPFIKLFGESIPKIKFWAS